jgi:O-antigen/teichoic acid export membrane protein
MLKHSSIYAIGNISRQLVGFIMLPIYTRFLTPADYGVIGLLTFAISLIDILFGARLVQAVPKFYHGEKDASIQNTVVSTALVITSVISAITTFIIIYNSSVTSNIIFGKTEYSDILAIYSTLVLTHAIENYGLLYIRIKQRPWLFLGFNLSKLVMQLSLNIWLLIFLEMGVMGIAISAAASSIIFATILATYTLIHTKINWDSIIAKNLVIFSWPLWLADFAGLYFGSANRYYMRIFASLDDIGLYELAAKFAAIISVLIWKPFNQYWQTERFDIYNNNDNPKTVYQSVFLGIATILIIAGLGISVLADPTIRIMSTPDYHHASVAVPILTLATVLYCLNGFLNFSQLVTDNTIWISKNNYLAAAIATIFFLLFIPPLGFLGAAIAYLCAVITQVALTYRASKQHYDMNLKLMPLMLMFIIAAGFYILAVHTYKADDIIIDILYRVLILGIGVGLITWVFITHSVDKALLLSIKKKILRKE